MTIYGFRHLSRLRESNARIHRLSTEVDTYERNRLYLQELEDEHCELQSQLAEVKHRWNAEYMPAMEKRQSLLRELDFARMHKEYYYARVADSLRGESANGLKALLNDLERPSVQVAAPTDADDEDSRPHPRSDIEVRAMLPALNKDGQETSRSHRGCSAATSTSSGSRHYRSWNLSDTNKRVDELESVRAQIKSEMSFIGAQTCALTVKLRKVENEITSLRNAMSLPCEHLYAGLQQELSTYKIEAIRRMLRVCVEPRPPVSQRLQSQATAASLDAPSLAYSVGTISTDISSIGLEFLKATQSSLSEIKARFLYTAAPE